MKTLLSIFSMIMGMFLLIPGAQANENDPPQSELINFSAALSISYCTEGQTGWCASTSVFSATRSLTLSPMFGISLSTGRLSSSGANGNTKLHRYPNQELKDHGANSESRRSSSSEEYPRLRGILPLVSVVNDLRLIGLVTVERSTFVMNGEPNHSYHFKVEIMGEEGVIAVMSTTVSDPSELVHVKLQTLDIKKMPFIYQGNLAIGPAVTMEECSGQTIPSGPEMISSATARILGPYECEYNSSIKQTNQWVLQ